MEVKTSNIEVRKICINLVASITLAVISYAAVAKLISIFYKPDVSLILQKAKVLLIPGFFNECRPEPMEKTLFILGILLIPVFLLACYFMIKRFLRDKSESFINRAWIFICLYAIITLPLFIYVILATQSYYVPRYSYGQLYILTSILDKNISLFHFVLAVPFIIILYFLLKVDYSAGSLYSKIIKKLSATICFLLIPYISALHLFSIYKLDHHFDAVFYSMVQLFKGAPLGVDGFTNTYGLYPYFLNVIFKVTGLSVLKCSIVFCVLIAICYLLILYYLKNTVHNPLAVFLGFTSVVFLPNLSVQLLSMKMMGIATPFYQYLPIRCLFPFLLLYLGASYIQNKNQYIYNLISVVCGLALLWNFESGVVTSLSWILLNCYSECEQDKVKTFLKNSAGHLIKILSLIIITVLCFLLVVYIFYGRIINPVSLIQTTLIFTQLGYFMLPLPLIHPWNILALAYITGMGICIMAAIEREITPWTKNVFLVTVLGTGMLLYYQGRSHDWMIMGMFFYFLILLTLFLYKAISFLTDNRNLLITLLSVLTATILSLSVILMAINVKDEYSLFKTTLKNIQAPSRAKDIIQSDCNFIRMHAKPSEKIIIFARDSATYFSKIPNASAFNPGFIECFLKTDYARLEKIMAGPDVKFFVAENDYFNVKTFSGLGKDLQMAASNGHMVLFKSKLDNR